MSHHTLTCKFYLPPLRMPCDVLSISPVIAVSVRQRHSWLRGLEQRNPKSHKHAALWGARKHTRAGHAA